MRLKEVNYYGLNHEKINEKFSGDLTYIRTFSIRGHHWAVYRAANPNLELGHKRYMMLGCTYDVPVDLTEDLTRKWYVSGSTEQQMNEERFQEGVLCTACDTVLYSINRHHFHKCGCKNETFVDGGKDYLRFGGANLKLIERVEIDLVDGTLTVRNDIPIMPADRVKLELYHYSENPEAKVLKPRKSSHSGEKRLKSGRKSGKTKTTRKAKTNGKDTHSRK